MFRPIAFLSLIALCAAGSAAQGQTANKPILGTWGVETQHISKSIKPGDDFYRYVNSGWLKDAKPPAGLPYANGFVDAYLRTQGRLETLVDKIVAGNPAPGTDEHIIASFYKSYLDVARLNQLGLSPIRADLTAMSAITTHEEAARWMARPFVPSVVSIGVELDDKNPKRYVLTADQPGLGLPAREFYLTADEPYAGFRIAYRAYIEDILTRAGVADAARQADAIVKFETAIAERSWTAVEKRDPVRAYHLVKTSDLATYAPGLPWGVMLKELELADQTEIVLKADTAIQKIAQLFASTDIATIRAYLMFRTVDSVAPGLSKQFQDLHFAFHSTKLSGIPEQMPLKSRAIANLSRHAGEVLGHVYVKTHFPPAHRAQMIKYVDHLRAAFRKLLLANDWMDEATRAEALAKLAAIRSHVGYPDRWRDYSGVSLDPADLIGNWRKLIQFEMADSRKSLGEPRRDWMFGYPAHEINAGYASSYNAIFFPAGILQSPFFDPDADAAVNFGSIVAVIGHEVGHGFDDQGSQSDGDGALRNWWTPQARAEFQKRAAVLVQQFNGYSPIEGMKVNGALTLGENIGDLGGLTVAYEAYKSFVETEQGGKAPVIDGFTGDQRFFLAWAQLWRNYTTPGQLRQNLLSDAHSPGEFRANGAVRNFAPWYAAFGVKEGDALYLPPDKRVKIW
ncbi:MAG: M13 family metallopeptidase [Hyphomicrobiaceae bacterium]